MMSWGVLSFCILEFTVMAYVTRGRSVANGTPHQLTVPKVPTYGTHGTVEGTPHQLTDSSDLHPSEDDEHRESVVKKASPLLDTEIRLREWKEREIARNRIDEHMTLRSFIGGKCCPIEMG